MISEDDRFIFENFRPSLFDQLAITEAFESLVFWIPDFRSTYILEKLHYVMFYAKDIVRSGDNLTIIEEYGSDYF